MVGYLWLVILKSKGSGTNFYLAYTTGSEIMVPRTFDNSIAANYATDRMSRRVASGTIIRVHQYYDTNYSTNNGFEDAVCIEDQSAS